MSKHWDIAYGAFTEMNAALGNAKVSERDRAKAVESMLNLCTGWLREYEKNQDAQAARWAAIESAAPPA